MKLESLKPPKGAVKSRKRLGRGRSSGYGKTSGRGQKGQLARSGGGKGPRFEGGQNPLQRRLPKLPGFKNPFKKVYATLNVEKLNGLKPSEKVDPASLAEKGLIKNSRLPVKVLGGGELKKKLTVKAHAFTKSAKEKIETAGGQVEVLKLSEVRRKQRRNDRSD